jgi:Domain of unknown function (DUF4407)
MCAQKSPSRRSAGSRIEAALTWLGGGDWRGLAERHERSSHAIAGVVVLLDAVLAWLVAALAVAGSTLWPMQAVVAVTLVFGVLVGAVTRAIAGGRLRGWAGIAGRGAVALAVGVIVGELATAVVLSGTIDRHLDEQAARNANSAPSVVRASADLDRMRAARAALDTAVEQARGHRDEALVVARCEYNPTPACPQTRITGEPGPGPETRTANDLLADAQRELDDALAARDRDAPGLDANVTGSEQALGQARRTAAAGADRGLGARLIAMNDHPSAGAVLLQLVAIGFFTLLSLLPFILRLWLGDTTHDRSAAAREARDRAELEAETAIAVKRAQVRAAAETLWAEQQLASARFAVEAQTEIDRAQYRRRVTEAVQGPLHATSQRESPPTNEDMYLPIAAEAEAASRAATELSAGTGDLPAQVTPADRGRGDGSTLVPSIPDVAKAAARWIRPLVPPFVARAIDTTTQPLRAARQVFEEVEEITFTLKRTHKVTVHSEESAGQPRPDASVATETRVDARGVDSSRAAPGLTGREHHSELTERHEPRELPRGQRQLPPGQ